MKNDQFALSPKRSIVAIKSDLEARLSVPDLRFINRKIPINEIARALGLRMGENRNIYCWRPELHKNADRTPSVGIRKVNNTVKCFGCGVGPLGSVDLVMNVLHLANPAEAAEWVADRFEVPDLAIGKHLVFPPGDRFKVGFEAPIELLVRSGLWARLSASSRSIVPVLLELSERIEESQNRTVSISYRALSRYSGVASPKGVAKALRELQEIGWLSVTTGNRAPGSGPIRNVSTYLITPKSDEVIDLANNHFAQMRSEIESEKKIRASHRAMRKAYSIT